MNHTSEFNQLTQGLSASQIARVLSCSRRQVIRYRVGEQPVPALTLAYLRLVLPTDGGAGQTSGSDT